MAAVPEPSSPKLAHRRPSFYEDRIDLADGFVEPGYASIEGVNVAELRSDFQSIVTGFTHRIHQIIKNTGVDLSSDTPQNPHHAAILFTKYLTSMDDAKDAIIKYTLACIGERNKRAKKED